MIAGAATDTGQKVHNLLSALTRLRPEDRIVVFADADIIPPRDWLTRIVAALAPPKVAAVSGYRWLVPDAQNLATLLVCAANASIATLPRLRNLNHAWGGTMALRRETLDALHMESVWQGSISDDLPLTTALKARGEAVVGPRELLLPTRVAYDWRGGLGFARRQYLLLRIYAPGLWALAATGTTLPLIGWATAVPLALAGDRLALAVIVVANALNQARALLRRRVVGALWGEEGLECMRGVLALNRWATPLCLGFHAAVIWSTLMAPPDRVGGPDLSHRVPAAAATAAQPGGRSQVMTAAAPPAAGRLGRSRVAPRLSPLLDPRAARWAVEGRTPSFHEAHADRGVLRAGRAARPPARPHGAPWYGCACAAQLPVAAAGGEPGAARARDAGNVEQPRTDHGRAVGDGPVCGHPDAWPSQAPSTCWQRSARGAPSSSPACIWRTGS